MYELYPRFAEVEERKKLWLRVQQFRKAFDYGTESLTKEEIEVAENISSHCFRPAEIRPIIMMTLLSLKPRHPSHPEILEAFKSNGWGKR